jgi:flagellar hook-length control protein FliK
MTFIQPSLKETQTVSAVSPVNQSNNENGFESMLNAIVLKELPQTLDLKIAEQIQALPTLELKSDISLSEQELLTNPIDMMRQAVQPEQAKEQIQSAAVNLTQEHVQKETPVGSPALKKTGLKKFEADMNGTEVDASMMSFLIPAAAHSRLVPLTLCEIEEGGEALHVGVDVSDSLASVNLETINPSYVKTDSKEDAKFDTKNDPTIDLGDKQMLTKTATKDAALPVSISKEQVAELTSTAQSVSHMMDKQTITIRPTPSRTAPAVQSDDDGVIEEVPIVSIALKRDPVMQGISVKKSFDSDPASKNETLKLAQTSDEVVQASKPMESKKDALESEVEAAEPLLESTAKEAVFKTVQSAGSIESSEAMTEVTVSKSVPTQQIQQAILDAKEGVSPKESKTLTVVLNPEELGVVNVELTSDETGKLRAVLSVEKRETLEVLQQDLNQLKTILKEIGIDESSISLQLSSNNDQGQQKQSEYIAWEDREQMLMRSPQTSAKAAMAEKATYPERQSARRLDIRA